MLPKTFVEGFHNVESVRKMEYNELGETGLFVSKISLGGGTFSQFYGEVDVPGAIRTIKQALSSGINYIDTAPWYGQGKSEEIYGMAFKEIPRSAYYIGTKVGRYELNAEEMFNFSKQKTRESVNKSLKLLGLDYVDIIQIHDIEFAPNLQIIFNETLPTLEEIVREGKAKHIGVTGYPLDVLKSAIEGAPGRFEVVLSYARYTLIDDSLKNYIDFFKKNKVGIICASGHGMGLLTNAGPQAWHPANDGIKMICQNAATLCKQSGIELGKLAMHHFIQLIGPSTFLVGMQTEELLAINLDAYFNGLTETEFKVLNEIKEKIFVKMTNWEGVELNEGNKFK